MMCEGAREREKVSADIPVDFCPLSWIFQLEPVIVGNQTGFKGGLTVEGSIGLLLMLRPSHAVSLNVSWIACFTYLVEITHTGNKI